MILPDIIVSDKNKNNVETNLCIRRKNWTNALILSAGLGIATGVAGLIINALALFGLLAENHFLKALGIWLIVVTFPLGALSAHCLDRLESIKKALKIEYCRNNGLPDEEQR
ncbi:MAG: hypothetical protein JSS81_19860 [Acidobacteria bacterium]|nr:hypothetical protein [Acidobacteriota bacterium]